MRVLVLIISDDSHAVYKHLRNIWRSYMDINPAITCLFVRANPSLKKEWKVSDDGKTIYCRCQENFIPGILEKTVLALGYLNDHDYVVRTNLSNFWIWDRLIDFLRTAPRQGFYAGKVGCNPDHINGGGIILSNDVAKMLYSDRNIIKRIPIIDDVAIWHYLVNIRGITPTSIDKRYDFVMRSSVPPLEEIKDAVNDKNIFAIRVKNQNREIVDVAIQQELLKQVYNISVSSV